MDDWEKLEPRCREIIGWRMQLIPYLTAAFQRYAEDGTPPFRALVPDAPQEKRLHSVDDQYMIGDRIIPVYVKSGSALPWDEVGLYAAAPESRVLTARVYGDGSTPFTFNGSQDMFTLAGATDMEASKENRADMMRSTGTTLAETTGLPVPSPIAAAGGTKKEIAIRA